MPPPYLTDEPSHPLLQITRSVGAIEKGIQTLERQQTEIADGQREVEEKVAALHQWIGGLVSQEECYGRRTEIEAAIKGGTVPEISAVKKPVKEGWLGRVADHAADITKIVGLLGLLAAALWAVHGFINRLEAAMVASEKKQQLVNQELMRRLDVPAKPRVIYVHTQPDAGRSGRRTRRRRRPRSGRRDSR